MANEKRLIDANAIEYPAYFYDNEAHPDPFIEGYRQGKIDAICDIRALAPTVDAVEVVHGRFELIEKAGVDYWRCSACQEIVAEYYHNRSITTAPTAVQRWIKTKIRNFICVFCEKISEYRG